MNEYAYRLEQKHGQDKEGKVFADDRFIAQLKAGQELQVPQHIIDRIKVRLVNKNVGQSAQ